MRVFLDSIKKKNKGFTLVELIVVLAILAILAAMLVPALTGYIDKANDKKLIAKARSLYTSSQSVVSGEYAKNSSFEKTTKYFEDSGMNTEIIKLSEVDGEYECYIALDSVYRVSELFYKENDKSVYLKDGQYEVAKDASKPATATITIKSKGKTFPGSKYTELASTLKKASTSDVKLLLSVEEMERRAIEIYEKSGETGKYAFVVKIKDDTGEAYFDKEMSRNSQVFKGVNSNSVVKYKNFYMILIDGNTITTNIVVDENSNSKHKVTIRESRIFIGRGHDDVVEGFNKPEEYK